MPDELDGHPVDDEQEEEEFAPARATMAPAHDPIDEDLMDHSEDEDDGLHILKPKLNQNHLINEEDADEFTDYLYNGYDNDDPNNPFLDDNEEEY